MIHYQLKQTISVLRLGPSVRLPREIPQTDVPFVLYDILEVGGVAAFPRFTLRVSTEASESSFRRDSCFIFHAMNVKSREDVELWHNHTLKG